VRGWVAAFVLRCCLSRRVLGIIVVATLLVPIYVPLTWTSDFHDFASR
jgi:hypothetical protein